MTIACAQQKLQQQRVDLRRLLLLHPVPGVGHEVHAEPARASLGLHALEGTRALEDAPVRGAGDVRGGHVDASAVEQRQFDKLRQVGDAAVPVQSPLNPVRANSDV